MLKILLKRLWCDIFNIKPQNQLRENLLNTLYEKMRELKYITMGNKSIKDGEDMILRKLIFSTSDLIEIVTPSKYNQEKIRIFLNDWFAQNIYPLFVLFLKENNAWGSFVFNHQRIHWPSTRGGAKDITSRCSPTDYLQTFSWVNSDKGIIYWVDINFRWEKLLEKLFDIKN